MRKRQRSNSARLRLKCIKPHETFTRTALFLFAGSTAPATGRLHVAPSVRSVNASHAPRASARWSRVETSRA
jgi:hypothetical protein